MDAWNENAKCPKCHSEGIATTYVSKHAASSVVANHMSTSEGYRNAYMTEHMRRWCRRCGFTWPERPLDAKEATDE